MAHFRIRKTLIACWFNVEADSITQAAFKARKLVPNRQVVLESHIIRKEKPNEPI